MRYIFTLLTVTLIVDSFGQELNGTINFTKDHRGYKMVEVTAKNLSESEEKAIYVKSDPLGHFNLKFDKGGKYRLSICGPFEPDTTFNIDISQNDKLVLIVNYPPKLCPYDKARTTGICPDEHHKDNVIPIVYGLVMGPRSFFRKVKKEKVELGGCMVTDCDPNWYCKTHDRRF